MLWVVSCLASFGHKLLGPLVIGFCANYLFSFAIRVFLPLIVSSFLYIGVLWTQIYFLFLCFQLASLTLIVSLVTIGVLLPPIVFFFAFAVWISVF